MEPKHFCSLSSLHGRRASFKEGIIKKIGKWVFQNEVWNRKRLVSTSHAETSAFIARITCYLLFSLQFPSQARSTSGVHDCHEIGKRKALRAEGLRLVEEFAAPKTSYAVWAKVAAGVGPISNSPVGRKMPNNC